MAATGLRDESAGIQIRHDRTCENTVRNKAVFAMSGMLRVMPDKPDKTRFK